MKKLIFLFSLLLFLGCSNDDNNSTEQEQLLDGGIIKSLQLVTLNTDNLSQSEYQASIDDMPLTLIRVSDNELLFKVPNDIDLGEKILTIPNLNNLKIKYEIVENILTGTAEENLSTYFTNIENYLSSIETTDNADYINGFFQRFEDSFQNLSELDKIEMAKYYKVNQSRFDDILTTDFANRMMFDGTDIELLTKFSIATLAFGLSTAYAVLPPYDPTDFIAIGVAFVTWNKARELKSEFAERNIKKLNILIDGIQSLLQSRNMMSELELTSGVASSFPLEGNSRAIIDSDLNDDNENIADYFSKHNTYNSTIESLNVAINFINDNFFLTDFDLIPLSTINETNPTITTLADQEFFERINFSIESDNVNVDNISFADGNVSITTSIIDESQVDEFVQTSINITYQDEFNLIVGSYPVNIYLENQIDLSGGWQMATDVICSDGNEWDSSEQGFFHIIFNNNGTINFTGQSNVFNGSLVQSEYNLNGDDLSLEFLLITTGNINCPWLGQDVERTLTTNYSFTGNYNGTVFIGNWDYSYQDETSPTCPEIDDLTTCSGPMTILRQ